MAISTGSKILWSDMSSLFSRISTVRRKFGYSAISASSYGGVGTLASTTNISNMKSLLEAVKGNGYAFSAVVAFTITVPTRGTLIKPGTMTPIQNMLTRLENTCVFDNFDGFDGFRSFDAFDGFNNFDSFDGFNNFDSFNGFDGFNGNVASCDYFNSNFTYNGFRCSPYNLTVTTN